VAITTDRSFAKKVFFVYPHSVIQDQLVTALIQSEYEVALVNDHQKASQLLYRFPSSIMFINIETGMDEPAWAQYIRALLGDCSKHDARIGVLTYNPTPELAQKYLMDIGVQCGFVALKLGLTESAKIILKTLDANEAKGDRKFVRVKSPLGKSSVNINHMGKVISGIVIDISSAGMACELDAEIRPQTTVDDIQVVIWGTIIKLTGIVMGQRPSPSGKILHVIMFNDDMPKESRTKVFAIIRKILQAEIDSI
jgi:hypothetical protein